MDSYPENEGVRQSLPQPLINASNTGHFPSKHPYKHFVSPECPKKYLRFHCTVAGIQRSLSLLQILGKPRKKTYFESLWTQLL